MKVSPSGTGSPAYVIDAPDDEAAWEIFERSGLRHSNHVFDPSLKGLPTGGLLPLLGGVSQTDPAAGS